MWQAVSMSFPSRFLCPVLICCLLSVGLWPQSATAWGHLGHRLTGEIAQALLSDTARKQVRQLLGEEPLAAAATYMDQQRNALSERWPASQRWHYDNQPVCTTARTYCADGQCATQQITRLQKLLADPRADRSERALALRLLIHILGDIHQPLHMADNSDRGGNNLYVRLHVGGERYRLHEVMDTVLIKELIGTQRLNAYAQDLKQRYRAQHAQWQQGSMANWAQQTHLLAVNRTYGTLPGFACNATANANGTTITLPAAYVQDAKRYLPEQLAKAGVRIAAVLNATLK